MQTANVSGKLDPAQSAAKTPDRLSDEEISNVESSVKTSGDESHEDTVVIACKMPNGLTLRVYREFDDPEPMQSGLTRIVKRFEPTGETFVVKGNALDLKKLSNQELPDYQIMNGYALTPNVPRRFWETWKEQHKDFVGLKNGLLFAQPTENRARDAAKAAGATRSGLEPIDPEDPSKTVPTSIAAKIRPSDRAAA